MQFSFRIGRLWAPFLASMFAAIPTLSVASPPVFQLPLDCTLGVDCRVQQYVDRDQGEGRKDFACGSLANDGHKGTDFAIPTLADMQRGVTVLAAAPGTVRGVRDGMPDIDASSPNTPDYSGRECGNGVAINHGNGWETQYCHMRKGSVLVRKGQKLNAGDPLGLVGMSGQATFPHVHFSVRHQKDVIDPFRPDMTVDCGAAPTNDMWANAPAYRAGGLVQVGIIDRVPEYDEVKEGLSVVSLPDTPPTALVVWGYAYNGKTGDRIELRLNGPDRLSEGDVVTLEKTQPLFYRAWGMRAPENGFASGDYVGTVIHRRGETVLDQQSISFRLP